MREQVPVGSKLVIEVELLNGFMSGEFCRLDPQGRTGGSTFGDFAREDCGEVFLVRPARITGSIAESGRLASNAGGSLIRGCENRTMDRTLDCPPVTSFGRNVCFARVAIWGDEPDMHPQESTWHVPRTVGRQA